MSAQPPTEQRLDIWLWTARHHKTRSLSAAEIDRGRVAVNGQPAKPAKLVRVGDLIDIRHPGQPHPTSLRVLGLAVTRGSATVAQTLYEETAESKALQARHRENQRLAPDPAAGIHHGRPTKKDRRDLGTAQRGWQRWSATLDDE
jgi:ribosome-associated heat shock protein Hsp15